MGCCSSTDQTVSNQKTPKGGPTTTQPDVNNQSDSSNKPLKSSENTQNELKNESDPKTNNVKTPQSSVTIPDSPIKPNKNNLDITQPNSPPSKIQSDQSIS